MIQKGQGGGGGGQVSAGLDPTHSLVQLVCDGARSPDYLAKVRIYTHRCEKGKAAQNVENMTLS